MSNQSVYIVAFPNLYNILNEINNMFAFDIYNYENYNDFVVEVKNKFNDSSSIIVAKNDYDLSLANYKIKKESVLIINELPIKIEILLDKINTHLIKQKYNFQSKLEIKGYILNLNSRIISKKMNEIKLTEKEIEIILFLNEKKKPQSVNNLQDKVWGYSYETETHTVETHIYRLRKKIKDLFNDENFIVSVNDGYKI